MVICFLGGINVLLIKKLTMFSLSGFIHYNNNGVTKEQAMALIVLPGQLVGGYGKKRVSISPQKNRD